MLARAVAEAHGGGVTFASAEGEGTTFRVALPRRAPGALTDYTQAPRGGSATSWPSNAV